MTISSERWRQRSQNLSSTTATAKELQLMTISSKKWHQRSQNLPPTTTTAKELRYWQAHPHKGPLQPYPISLNFPFQFFEGQRVPEEFRLGGSVKTVSFLHSILSRMMALLFPSRPGGSSELFAHRIPFHTVTVALPTGRRVPMNISPIGYHIMPQPSHFLPAGGL
ncbi:hypothetical protein NPIL_532971 [Nephila pilipes]|uniref:Uncharacterized protein n=1 Tax=Nephila pilipes TaxID=299642 RepID=A0A8X6P086_NEPPI|nr:hypothetical protein NPIL_532971 [Nephila pilipes]